MIYVVLVFLLASVVKSAVGFGDALLSMPILALLMDAQTAVPVVGLVTTITSLVIALWDWRDLKFKAAWRLIVGGVVGIPIGIFILKFAPEGWVKGGLGLLLVAYGLYALFRPALPPLKGKAWGYLFGFASGCLSGAYTTGGPPAVFYGSLKRWPPATFRVTLQGIFIPIGLMTATGHAAAGFYTREALILVGAGLIPVVLGIPLGRLLNRRVPAASFSKVIYAVLVFLGILLMVPKG